jgi:hypothetical protein
MGKRADFIVSLPAVVDVIIELKGSDVAEAVGQIRATREFWTNHDLAGRRHGALIVRGQGIHPKQQANIQRWRTEFRIKYSMRLIIETRNREYDFAEF